MTRFWAALLAAAVIALATESFVTAASEGHHAGAITVTLSPMRLTIDPSDDTLVLTIGN